MYTDDQKFAMRIKELRNTWGLTQQQMADMVGVRKTTISNYESGYATCTISTLRRFMECFNLPASYFIPVELNEKAEKMFYGTPVPYYEPTNLKGLLSGEIIHSNSTLSLPAGMNMPKNKYMATLAPDNSMNKYGIKRGTCLIIDKEKTEPSHDDIFAAVHRKILMVRRFHKDEMGCFMIAESTRIPTGHSIEEIPKEDFKILGIVTKMIVNV